MDDLGLLTIFGDSGEFDKCDAFDDLDMGLNEFPVNTSAIPHDTMFELPFLDNEEADEDKNEQNGKETNIENNRKNKSKSKVKNMVGSGEHPDCDIFENLDFGLNDFPVDISIMPQDTVFDVFNDDFEKVNEDTREQTRQATYKGNNEKNENKRKAKKKELQ
mmetsp:Transcript_8947/g.10989  ORF Transcript_8947/g.10989 Transcript_8947/m.10989 type:complete len:162 (+) Transcript_8947:67-552(+)